MPPLVIMRIQFSFEREPLWMLLFSYAPALVGLFIFLIALIVRHMF